VVLAGMFLMAWNVIRTWQQAGEIVATPVLPPDTASAHA
jgi:cytochrome c oxidase cbb3-type subunit 1